MISESCANPTNKTVLVTEERVFGFGFGFGFRGILHYGEDEAETHPENRGEKFDSPPHHLEVVRGHEVGLAGEIDALCVQFVAMRVQRHATGIRLFVHRHYYQVLQ